MYRKYRRKGTTEMMPWHEAVDTSSVSISDADRDNGSPKHGDYIARNPSNHSDRWLVSAEFFEKNEFVAVDDAD